MDIYEELKKSEGEKIREKLIDTFNFYDPAMNSPFLLGIHRKDIIAWLEKQGEEKTVNYPIEGMFPYTDPADTLDGEIENIWNKLRNCDNTFTAAKSGFYEVIHHFANWLEKQGEQTKIEALRTEYEKGRADTLSEMKSSWSEEDEHLSYWTIHNLTELKNRFGENYGDSGKCIDWIKQLKQRIGGYSYDRRNETTGSQNVQ